jgi:hypothetical protein
MNPTVDNRRETVFLSLRNRGRSLVPIRQGQKLIDEGAFEKPAKATLCHSLHVCLSVCLSTVTEREKKKGGRPLSVRPNKLKNARDGY